MGIQSECACACVPYAFVVHRIHSYTHNTHAHTPNAHTHTTKQPELPLFMSVIRTLLRVSALLFDLVRVCVFARGFCTVSEHTQTYKLDTFLTANDPNSHTNAHKDSPARTQSLATTRTVADSPTLIPSPTKQNKRKQTTLHTRKHSISQRKQKPKLKQSVYLSLSLNP